MPVTVVTPPAVEPLSLDELVKPYLRVDHDEEDALLRELIVGARQYAENFCERSFGKQTLRYTMDYFPAGELILPRATPLVSVTAVAYYSADWVLTTLDAAAYELDAGHVPGRLLLAEGEVWPATRRGQNAVSVTYAAGSLTVPHEVRQAMLIHLTHRYENRAGGEVPEAVDCLLRPFKVLAEHWG